MSGKAARVTLTETMYGILQRLANSRKLPANIAVRAQIVLSAFHRQNNAQISSAVHLGTQQVGLWRRRWKASFEALLAMQFVESAAAFERAIIDTLRDAPRSGSSGKFSAEQVVGIVSIACEDPKQSDRPVTTWTGRELADEAIKRGLVPSISTSQVEVIFGIISRRVMRGGSFTSKADLTDKLHRFIDYFTRTYAKPMNWTYNGRPTKTRADSRPRTWREIRQTASIAKKVALVMGQM